MKIAVTGATGRVGHHTVDVLEGRGHVVVPISRSTGVDVVTGTGLAEALTGVECIVDTATGPSPDKQEATEWFTNAARNLQAASDEAGVQRIVEVSIIGIDRFRGGYAAAKFIHEQAMLAGPVPVQILRANVFHEFVPQLVAWGTQGDVAYVRNELRQPVAARCVAESLADLATGPWPEPGAPIPEIAGPRAERLVDLAFRLVARRGDRLRIESASDPTDPDRELYEGDALLAGRHAALVGPTFDEWLDSTLTVTTK